MAQSSSSSSSSSVSLLGAHLWKHCTTVARKKLEMMAAMDTATPEKMMMNKSVRDRLNLHSLKLASDSSRRATLRSSMGSEHWMASRPERQNEREKIRLQPPTVVPHGRKSHSTSFGNLTSQVHTHLGLRAQAFSSGDFLLSVDRFVRCVFSGETSFSQETERPSILGYFWCLHILRKPLSFSVTVFPSSRAQSTLSQHCLRVNSLPSLLICPLGPEKSNLTHCPVPQISLGVLTCYPFFSSSEQKMEKEYLSFLPPSVLAHPLHIHGHPTHSFLHGNSCLATIWHSLLSLNRCNCLGVSRI